MELLRRFHEHRQIRSSYEGLWQEISNITTSRPRVFSSVSYHQGGGDWTTQSFDTTAQNSCNRWIAIFLGLLTNPADRWLKLSVFGEKPDYNTRVFFERIEDVFLASFQNHGFYDMATSVYESCGYFGNAMSLVDERPYGGKRGFQGFRFVEIPFEQAYFAEDGNSEVRHVYRRVMWDAYSIVSYFGDRDLPGEIRKYVDDPKRKFSCIHEVRPKDPDRTDSRFISTWVIEELKHEVYSEEITGNPYVATRMPRTGGEVYGRGPAYDCLSSIKSLNYQAWQRDQAFGFLANPVRLFNRMLRLPIEGMSPGAWLAANGDVGPASIRELGNNINPEIFRVMAEPHIQAVRSAFYADQIEIAMARPEYGKTGVASEISGRNRILLAPALNAINRSFVVPVIARCLQVFFDAISGRAEIPDQIVKNGVNVEIVGPLALAQKAAKMEGFRNALADMSAIIQLKPESAANVNGDRSLRFIADTNWMPTEMLNSPAEMSAIREQEARLREAQNQLDALSQGAPAMKDIAQAQALMRGGQ